MNINEVIQELRNYKEDCLNEWERYKNWNIPEQAKYYKGIMHGLTVGIDYLKGCEMDWKKWLEDYTQVCADVFGEYSLEEDKKELERLQKEFLEKLVNE